MTKENKKTSDKNAQKILDLENKIGELDNNWKRALADYKNLEKRSEENKKLIVDFANTVLIEQLLPILDNFEQIEKHSKDMGIKLSIKEFKQTLYNAGLVKIEIQVGKEFNPEYMDAIETKHDDNKTNTVSSIEREGYKFKGKLIRPISVVVS